MSVACRVVLAAAASLAVMPGAAQAQQGGETGTAQPAAEFAVPRFRSADKDRKPPDLKQVVTVRFLVDDGFPPFSYQVSGGTLGGFSVIVADAVCSDLRLNCEFIPTPWSELTDALEQGKGDALVSGLAMSPETVETLDFTQPYYRGSARFAVRATSPIAEPDIRALAGKRIGVVAATSHEAWLKRFYPRSTIRGFNNQNEVMEALRTGVVDAAFGDGIKMVFWLGGAVSQDCCRFAGRGYYDPDGFSQPMTFAVRRGNDAVRQVLDYGLDRIEQSGTFARLYRQFFPVSPW